MSESDSIKQFIDDYWNHDDPDAKKLTVKEKTKEVYEQSGKLIIRPMESHHIHKSTWISLIVLAIVIPILLYLSVTIFHGKKYLICSLIIVIGAMIPFFVTFEGRKPKAREIIVIAVISAIGVAGRAAFFMVPNFKPVAAVVIIAAVSFGAEAGFLTGCITIMASNMFMGQGPWTPWQMFAYGIIGFLCGILFKKGFLKPNKLSLCIYGFLSVVLIFGGIMNPASVLMSYGYLTWQSVLAFYISGLPVDLVHAASTVVFLWVLSRPMLEKLERIKVKYGLCDRTDLES